MSPDVTKYEAISNEVFILKKGKPESLKLLPLITHTEDKEISLIIIQAYSQVQNVRHFIKLMCFL